MEIQFLTAADVAHGVLSLVGRQAVQLAVFVLLTVVT